jgi:hypothetical protein
MEEKGENMNEDNNMTVKEIVVNYLKSNGYDGLYSESCGCEISDLAPCDIIGLNCKAGYKIDCPCHTCTNDCEVSNCIYPQCEVRDMNPHWIIQGKKP